MNAPSPLLLPPDAYHQSIVTLELCSVMVVSREAWTAIERDHPLQACKVLASLQQGCENKVGAFTSSIQGLTVRTTFDSNCP